MDNLIETEDFVEGYDQDGIGADGDDPSGTTQGQGQLDSTDFTNNVVESGDVEAATRARALNTVKGIKDRKISTDKRTTTPYMTKYERARVLGTRALQIRYVCHLYLPARTPCWRSRQVRVPLTMHQHECASTRGRRRRDRPSANRHQRASREEDTAGRAEISARWVVCLLLL